MVFDTLDKLKPHTMSIGASTGVVASIFAIGEWGQSKDFTQTMVAAAIGGLAGAFIGSAIVLGVNYSRGVGATPMTPIFGSLGAGAPMVLDLVNRVQGKAGKTNRELIRIGAVGGTVGTLIGVAIDYYRGQL